MALSDADGMTRFYPAGGDQAAAPGFVQRFPKFVSPTSNVNAEEVVL